MAEKQSGSNRGLSQKVQPDNALARVVGREPQPRTEIVKKMWAYIKSNDLQDPENGRIIIADDKLRPIFDGQDRVNMFEMTKLVNQHVE